MVDKVSVGWLRGEVASSQWSLSCHDYLSTYSTHQEKHCTQLRQLDLDSTSWVLVKVDPSGLSVTLNAR